MASDIWGLVVLGRFRLGGSFSPQMKKVLGKTKKNT
jgi:hypothetical protein